VCLTFLTHFPLPLQEEEGDPFGAYCPSNQPCEYRYLNQSAGYLVAGAHSGSNTNKYYSIDIGLVHFVVLSTNPYLGLTSSIRKAQLAWFEQDLITANANRANVPWVILVTHVPMYCSAVTMEFLANHSDGLPPYQGCVAQGDAGVLIQKDMEALMYKYGVDLYFAGHIHAHESLYPLYNDTCMGRSFEDPKATVHILGGAAGAPGIVDTFGTPSPCTRATLAEWSYGAITVHNSTHLTYEHFFNSNNTLFDSFTIVQTNHGPF
jgi:acid phosphatase type 7